MVPETGFSVIIGSSNFFQVFFNALKIVSRTSCFFSVQIPYAQLTCCISLLPKSSLSTMFNPEEIKVNTHVYSLSPKYVHLVRLLCVCGAGGARGIGARTQVLLYTRQTFYH